jgi:hypothetical protein
MAARYSNFGVDAARAVTQWRLSRHLVNASTSPLSLLEVFARLPPDFTDLRMLYVSQ